MGSAIATEIGNQVPTLVADLTAVGGALASLILTVVIAGTVVSFLRRKAGR